MQSIANMFLVPVGVYYGAPFGVGYYIWKSMSTYPSPPVIVGSADSDLVPAALGNIVGGVGFVGVSYWYMHMTAGEAVSRDFDKMDAAAINGLANGYHMDGHSKEDSELRHRNNKGDSAV